MRVEEMPMEEMKKNTDLQTIETVDETAEAAEKETVPAIWCCWQKTIPVIRTFANWCLWAPLKASTISPV